MNERSKDGADPDATVMLPAGFGKRAADEDATVMIPPARADDDATVMISAIKPDEDATVMIAAPGPDDDATVLMPAAAMEPDPEATIAIPTPGRRRETDALRPVPVVGTIAAPMDIGELGGINPLAAAANPVLAAVAQIRHTLSHPDPEGLRANLRQRIEAFEAAARAVRVDDDTVAAARIALAALVDESAASTPWGASWAADADGKFFQLLERFSADPAANRDLLEFLYVCLALGYEGSYREQAGSRESLTKIRAKLLGQLRGVRPPRDGELSSNWRGKDAPARRPRGALGFWVAISGAAVLLAALYVGYSVSLGSLSDPVARELAQLRAVPEPPLARAVGRPAAAQDVSSHLADEIARGEIAIVDAPGVSTIVIRSDRLFASGSARLEADVEPVVLRVAAALDRVPGTILVTGHTDDVPIRTARFPSNWELSAERAASVLKLMAGNLKEPARLHAEGLADSAPAAPNDSAASRARNRRVEIVLRSGP